MAGRTGILPPNLRPYSFRMRPSISTKMENGLRLPRCDIQAVFFSPERLVLNSTPSFHDLK